MTQEQIRSRATELRLKWKHKEAKARAAKGRYFAYQELCEHPDAFTTYDYAGGTGRKCPDCGWER
jgi:nitrite reductase/ring-hydroxylating ferredoxin subunit